MPKHHKTIVETNPIEFDELKKRITETAEASGVEVIEFVIDDNHKLAAVTYRSGRAVEFEEVVEWVRGDGYKPYQVGPINLDDRFNV